jgi:hypothetical protein
MHLSNALPDALFMQRSLSNSSCISLGILLCSGEPMHFCMFLIVMHSAGMRDGRTDPGGWDVVGKLFFIHMHVRIDITPSFP